MLRITSREKPGNQGEYSTRNYYGDDYIPEPVFNLVSFLFGVVDPLTHTFHKSFGIRPEFRNVFDIPLNAVNNLPDMFYSDLQTRFLHSINGYNLRFKVFMI